MLDSRVLEVRPLGLRVLRHARASATRSTPSARSASTRAATATRAPRSTTSTSARRVHGVPGHARQVVAPARAARRAATSTARRSPRRPSRFNPVTGAIAVRRGRVPDGARYTSGGRYVQDVFEAMPGRLRLVGNLRWSARLVRGARRRQPARERAGRCGPTTRADFSSLTFRAGAVLTPDAGWSFTRQRQPRLPRAAHHRPGHGGPHGRGLRGRARRRRGPRRHRRLAPPTRPPCRPGQPADALEPERSLSYEAGGALPPRRGSTASSRCFVNDIDGNIQKQALILPPGAVGHHPGRPDHQPPDRRTARSSCRSPRARCWSTPTSTTRASGASSTRST